MVGAFAPDTSFFSVAVRWLVLTRLTSMKKTNTIPKEIECPCCEDGQRQYFDGNLHCETCDGTGTVTVIPCPLHGTDGYVYSETDEVALVCTKCRGEDADELCNLNHLLTVGRTLPAELIALAEASARGEDFDLERFNTLFQEAR